MKCFSFSRLSFLTCLIIASACANHSSSELAEYSDEVYNPTYASGFSITGKDGSESTLISVSNPWQGADSVASLLFIERDGNEAPLSFSGQILDSEAKRIIAMSSTHIALLDALGATDRIVGVSGIDFITNPDIRKRKDVIADVGYDGNINYETLLAANPDLVLLYGVNGASPMEDKLRELQIPFLYIGDYLEQSPLGKAEWIIPLAEIIGRREKGIELFDGISQRYDSLKNKVAESVIEAPAVMLNVPYADSWFMPSASGYMATLIKDAGAHYIYHKDTGTVSAPIDLEEAFLLVSGADFWLNTDQIESLSELGTKYPRFRNTRVFRNSDVFNNTLRANAAGGNDFFESGIVMPDAVLSDLITIFHPELSNDSLTFYRKLR